MADNVITVDVAVYGGGHGGAFAAKNLAQRGHKVALVDKDDYMEVCASVVRSLVQPEFAERAVIPLRAGLPEVQFVHGKLVELARDGQGTVVLHAADGSAPRITVKAKAVVLCTGQRYKDSAPRSSQEATTEARLDFYRRFAARVAEARHIVVGGGGPAGVEFAAEVVCRYRGAEAKQVTVVTSGDRLLATSAASASKVAHEFMAAHHVEVVTNTRVDRETGDGHVLLDNGRQLAADVVFWAIGGRPNSEYMEAHWREVLNNKGEIAVDGRFVVSGGEAARVFAVGDVAALDGEPKLAWLVGSQWPVVAHNVDQALRGHTGFKTYKTHPGDPRMGVTLGPDAGVFQLPYVGTISWGWFVRMAKSRDMMVTPTRKQFGLS